MCGVNQAHPIETDNRGSSRSHAFRSFVRSNVLELVTTVVVLALIAGIFEHNFAPIRIEPAMQAGQTAGAALLDLRGELSIYALSKDTYPERLESLGDRRNPFTDTILNAGYTLEYRPQPPSKDAHFRGFTILACRRESDYVNLYIDQSGIVRYTREPRPASVNDAPF
jgi:hypothetical protein